jgi:hypothetical protein
MSFNTREKSCPPPAADEAGSCPAQAARAATTTTAATRETPENGRKYCGTRITLRTLFIIWRAFGQVLPLM